MPGPGARQRARVGRRLARGAVLDHEPRDRAIVDGLERTVGAARDHLLVRQPDIEPPVVPERPPDVEQVVVRMS